MQVVQGTWTPAKDFLGFPTQLGLSWKDYFLLTLSAWAPNRKHNGKTLLPLFILGRLVVLSQLLQVPSVILHRSKHSQAANNFWGLCAWATCKHPAANLGRPWRSLDPLSLVNPKTGPPKLNRSLSKLCYQPALQNQKPVMGMSWM